MVPIARIAAPITRIEMHNNSSNTTNIKVLTAKTAVPTTEIAVLTSRTAALTTSVCHGYDIRTGSRAVGVGPEN